MFGYIKGGPVRPNGGAVSLYFEAIGANECVLCGATDKLTGEHKIKASVLREEFSDRAMMMRGVAGLRMVQSPKSKILHFRSKLCSRCNSERTQPADRAFDQLHLGMLARRADELPLVDEAFRPACTLDPEARINCFRYFSKILCLFLAEVGGGRPKALASFALHRSNFNPIFLRVSEDDKYESMLGLLTAEGFASHGGLRLGFDEGGAKVESIRSSISAGGVRYDFWVQLGWLAALEFSLLYPALVELARRDIEKQLMGGC